MRDVVNYATTKTQQYRGNHGGMVYRFSKCLDSDTLVVIAEVKKDEAWIVSCFYY
jgi:hypothetical protein